MISIYFLLLALQAPTSDDTDNSRRVAYFCNFSADNNEKLKGQETLKLSAMLPSPDRRKSVSQGIITDDPSNYMSGSKFSKYEFAAGDNSETMSFSNDDGYLMLVLPGDKPGIVYASVGNIRSGSGPYIGKCALISIKEDWFYDVAQGKTSQ